jgi:hypothetical protein
MDLSMTLSKPCAGKPGSGALSFEGLDGARVNARAAEFIAKPGRADELRDHICKAVTPFLRERSEFIRTIVLTSDEEPRRVVAITFWSLEEHTCTPWEESPLVREILSPLVDVWPRGRTYQVDLTETTETDEQAISLPAC